MNATHCTGATSTDIEIRVTSISTCTDIDPATIVLSWFTSFGGAHGDHVDVHLDPNDPWLYCWMYVARKNEDGISVSIRVATGSAAIKSDANEIGIPMRGLDNSVVAQIKIEYLLTGVGVSACKKVLARGAIDSCIRAQERYWASKIALHAEKFHREEWRYSSAVFPRPVGKLPYWAFFSFCKGAVRADPGALEHLCALSKRRLRVPDAAYISKRPSLALAMLCEMATLIPTSLVYAVDRDARYREDDQWARIMCNPMLRDAGYDCEDGTELALQILCTVAKLPITQGMSDELAVLVRTSRAYKPLACLTEILIGQNQYMFHAVPVLLRRSAYESYMAGKPALVATSARPLGAIAETTHLFECISTGNPSKYFVENMIIDSPPEPVQGRISFAYANHARMYGKVVALIDPAGMKSGGVPQVAVVDREGKHTVRLLDLVTTACDAKFESVLPSKLSAQTINQVHKTLACLAPAFLIDTADEKMPPSKRTDKQQVYYCRKDEWDKGVKAQMTSMLRARGVDVGVNMKETVLHVTKQIEIVEILVTPRHHAHE